MSYRTDSAGDRSVAHAPMVLVAPHPPLRRYYAKDDKRQVFLSELFNGLLRDYRAVKVEKHA